MTELDEIALSIINKAGTARLQKWKSLKDVHSDLKETEKDYMDNSRAYDVAVIICDKLFI